MTSSRRGGNLLLVDGEPIGVERRNGFAG